MKFFEKNKKTLTIAIKFWSLSIFLLVTIGFSGITSFGAEVPYVEPSVELRGAWVATVGNIDMPKQNGTTEAAILQYKSFYLSILDRLQLNNMNAVFFQVRPMNDAFYPSAYNPWSAYLAGYGVDPGWDPLAWMIQVTHERGIEFHAWLNPYRTSPSGLPLSSTQEEINQYKINYANSQRTSLKETYNNPLFETNQSKFLSKVVMGAENKMILNPAHPEVIKHIENTIDELITNYELDGIHFDDYFYPSGSPYGGVPIESSVDQADYNAYLATNPFMTIANWRRQNVDIMVKSVSDLVRGFNQTSPRARKVSFGISPAPLWAPAKSPGCSAGVEGGVEGVACWGYSTYNQLFADTKKWVEEEWIDYIVPQAYMKFEDNYSIIINWWANVCAPTRVKLYIGSAVYQLQTWNNEKGVYNQMLYNGKNPDLIGKIHGYVFFSYKNIATTGDIFSRGMSWIRSLWKKQAITPVYYQSEAIVTTSPAAQIYEMPQQMRITFNQVANARGYALYHFTENEPIAFTQNKLVNIIPQVENTVARTVDFVKNASTSKYVLRTIDANNEFIEHCTVINVVEVVPNSAPVISNVDFFNSKDTLIGGENVMIQAKITDRELNPLSVKLLLATDGENFSREFNMQVNGDIYTYNWEVYYLNLPNALFKIVATDGDKTTEVISAPFKVKASAFEAPVLSNVSFGIASSLTSGKNIAVKVNVASDDPVTVKLYFALDGENFDQSFDMVAKDGIYSYNWKVPSTTSDNARLKIVASNGEEAMTTSESFQIKIASSSSNCNTTAMIYFWNLLALTSVVLLIRKRVK